MSLLRMQKSRLILRRIRERFQRLQARYTKHTQTLSTSTPESAAFYTPATHTPVCESPTNSQTCVSSTSKPNEDFEVDEHEEDSCEITPITPIEQSHSAISPAQGLTASLSYEERIGGSNKSELAATDEMIDVSANATNPDQTEVVTSKKSDTQEDDTTINPATREQNTPWTLTLSSNPRPPLSCRHNRPAKKGKPKHIHHLLHCYCDLCQQGAREEIVQIAYVLQRLLPADVIPAILDFAGMQIRDQLSVYPPGGHPIYIGYMYVKPEPFEYAGVVVPAHIPRGSIRSVSIFVECSYHGINDDVYHGTLPTPLDSPKTSISVGVIGLDDQEVCKPNYYRSPSTTEGSTRPLYKYGSKSLISNEERHEAYELIWTREDEDEDIRQILKELKGGSGIEFTATTLRPYHVVSYIAEITIDHAVVTKL